MSVAGQALATSAPTLPSLFAGVASVSALYEHLDSTPGIAPTSEPIFASFGDGNSTYGSSTLYARAAPYYPGDTVTGLPALLCTAGLPPACTAPQFPLMAIANQLHSSASINFVPEVVPGGSLPLSVSALSGTAKATADGGVSTTASVSTVDESQSAGRAQVGALRTALAAIVGHPVGASSNALLHIGSMTGTTKSSFEGATLHVHAESQVSGIELLGGAVKIASASAVSDATNDGAGKHTHTDHASLGAVTVAGIPAAIDDTGITIKGVGIPTSVVTGVTTALQQALAGLGADIHLIGHTEGSSVLQPRTCASGEADGLQLHISRDLRQVPIEGAVFYDDIAIGSACTSASVGAADVTTSPAPPSSGPSDSGFAPAPAVLAPSSPAPSGTPSAPVAASPSPSPSAEVSSPAPLEALPVVHLPESDLRGHLIADRLSLLYAAFALLAIAVLLGATPLLRPHRSRPADRGDSP